MFKKLNFFRKSAEKSYKADVEYLLSSATEVCNELASSTLSHLDIKDYKYDSAQAVEELGIDKELVQQLVEDYVSQIIKAVVQFDVYLEKLQDHKDEKKELDYTLFRELAHKNLGVARNLRIKDAEKLLYELMKKDDLEYLLVCLEALKVCAIKLKPKCAYDTIKLMRIKNSL